MTEWTIGEVERAVKWNSPCDVLIEYLPGTGILEWNINSIYFYDNAEDALEHFNKEAKKPRNKTFIIGKVDPDGMMTVTNMKGSSKDEIIPGIVLCWSDERKCVEISAGLDQHGEGKLELSKLGIPLDDSVWE